MSISTSDQMPDAAAATGAESVSPGLSRSTGEPQNVLRGAWFAVVTFGLGIFSLVASEFLPASLLTPIATDLGLSEGTVGQLVTATAIAGIAAGPGLVALLPPIDRRRVMLALTALSVVANLIVTLLPVFPMMLLGRALLGIALSGFWALSLSVVSTLVPPAALGRAMTVVNSGLALATVAAVPIGTAVAAQLGWQAAFGGVAILGAITLVLQFIALPPIAPTEKSGLRPLLQTLTTRYIAFGFLGLAFVVVGHMAAFTYIRPMLDRVDGIDTGLLAVLLAVFGAMSFVGNLMAGYLATRSIRLLLVLVPSLIAATTVTLALAGTSLPVALVAVALWGLGFGAVPTMVQTWLARVAPDRLESGGGLTVGTFQVSIAGGAAAGGLLFDNLGAQWAFGIGGIAALLGAVIFSRVRTR